MKKHPTQICLLILLFSICLSLPAAPVLRIGIFSDTHVTEDPGSCILLEKALTLFKNKRAEMVINAGDIAQVYNEKAYRNYRETVNKVYRSKKTPEIFVYANHDRMRRNKESVWKVFKDVKKHLEIPNDPYDEIKFKGYTFVVIPQFADMARYKAMLDKAVRENPDKPVFVIDHVPPANTVFATGGLTKERRELLDNYPSVILICGHKHNTLESELAVWQGNFTVIHAGCLQVWRPYLIGTPWMSLKSTHVLFLEVYKDKLIFRRYDAVTGKEHKPDTPWIIPLPFDKKTAPYNPERRRQASSAPEFAPGAKISVSHDEKYVNFTFPHARHTDGVYRYQTELFRHEGNKKVLFARSDRNGNFTNPEKKQAKFQFNNGYFQAGKGYTLRITPTNFWKKEGKALEQTFSVPAQKNYEICFESNAPAADCKVFEGTPGGKRLYPDKDGFFPIPANQNLCLVFPGNIWKGKAWTPYRFTVEMHLKDTLPVPRFMTLRNPDPIDSATGRVLLPQGDSGNLRYVFYHSKREDDYNYYLLLLPGSKGKVRFNYIKSEKLSH